MSTAPAVPLGVVHVNEVEETRTTEVQEDPPTVTVEPTEKSVPVIVIAVPPEVRPEVGDTEETDGPGL